MVWFVTYVLDVFELLYIDVYELLYIDVLIKFISEFLK